MRASGLGGGLYTEPASALRAENPALAEMHDELAAHEAFEARTAQKRSQLLVERAVERLDVHNVRNTPVTTPRIWTCRA